MSKFHVKIGSLEVEDSKIIKAIQTKKIVSYPDRAMSESLVKLIPGRVRDQRNLRRLPELRQSIGQIILPWQSFLGRHRPKRSQKQPKKNRGENMRLQ